MRQRMGLECDGIHYVKLMPLPFRTNMPRRIAALLLLVVAMLNFSARAALDDHHLKAPAFHELCAVCAYTGGSLGLPEDASSLQSPRQQHSLPPAPAIVALVSPEPPRPTIRGPPLPA